MLDPPSDGRLNQSCPYLSHPGRYGTKKDKPGFEVWGAILGDQMVAAALIGTPGLPMHNSVPENDAYFGSC